MRMIYDDGAPLDAQGLLSACPKCGNGDFPKGAKKCGVCGTDRRNVCMPRNRRDPAHVNAPNARFCEICGAETVLFHYGVLKPWPDALDELRRKARPKLSEPDALPF